MTFDSEQAERAAWAQYHRTGWSGWIAHWADIPGEGYVRIGWYGWGTAP